jgi:hypothetical protein
VTGVVVVVVAVVVRVVVVVGVVVGVVVVVPAGVTVEVEPPVPVWTTRRGGLALSRLSNATARVEGSVIAKFTTPPADAADVTSTLTQLPAVIAPEELTSVPTAGAFVPVSEDSSHEPLTAWTSTPDGRSESAWIESVTLVTEAVGAGSANRRYEITDGEPSARSLTSVPSFSVGDADETYASAVAFTAVEESVPLELATDTPTAKRMRVRSPRTSRSRRMVFFNVFRLPLSHRSRSGERFFG